MKKLFYSALCILCSAFSMNAFAEVDKLDDKARIALTPIVLDDAIPAGAHKQLETKMTQIAAKNGCAAIDNSRFIITCTANVLTQDITPTAPPMHAYTLALTFFVGDGVEGRLFASTTIEAKGVGQTPDKAYINALKNIRVNDPAFKSMVDKGKEQIIEYYNTQCDFVITDARTMVKRQEYTAALSLLTSVPTICEECYKRSLDVTVEVYQAWRDHVCLMALNKAEAAWAKRDADAAAKALEDIPSDGACVEDANKLKKEIAAKLDAKEREEWEFKMKQYEDKMELKRQEMDLRQQEMDQQQVTVSPQEQVRTNAVYELQEAKKAAPQNQAPAAKPVYQVKGKWFN